MGGEDRTGFLMELRPNRHLTIATAGHIDHGKTSLVRALTGMETDRLEEEQRRGITIELGFAFLGDQITIIDVPGHERFIKTMVAGVSTVDLGLFVIAADDGVMPQSREHLAILSLLGIPHLFVAITKVEGLEADWVDLVESDLRALLPKQYTDCRFFRCDSISGSGIPELKSALVHYAQNLPLRQQSGVFRLPIDRVFSLKGHGTVVTGTILSGKVQEGEKLALLPDGVEIRVRSLQSHGSKRNALEAGDRAALNILGTDPALIKRGDWLAEKGIFQPTDLLDVELQSLPDATPIKNRERIHLHLGTSEVLGRIILFGVDVIQPGDTAYAQLILEEKVLATRDDRFVIRRYSPLETLGGGRVLDPVPQRRARHDPKAIEWLKVLADATGPASALQLKVDDAGISGLSLNSALTFLGISRNELENSLSESLQGQSIKQFGLGDALWLISDSNYESLKQNTLTQIEEYHLAHPDLLGMKPAALAFPDVPQTLLDSTVEDLLKTELSLEKGFLRARSHEIQLGKVVEELSNHLEAILEEVGLEPPGLQAICTQLKISDSELQRLLSIMSQQGRIFRMADGTPWTQHRLSEMWKIVHGALSSGQAKSMGELREALGCSRRNAVALMEFFDGMGLTQRDEDFRLPGINFRKDFAINK
jgi:selenocysteine-specific elongation factor